ncbi:MAG: hypothetical protein OEZ43_06860 [Gammaproteobacteria bacterium]|nr:hypothetical protein [Gammaproteobacteria bacterium]
MEKYSQKPDSAYLKSARLLLLLLCMLALSPQLYAAELMPTKAPWITPNDDDLRLVEVRFKQYILAKTIIIYESTGGALLPIREISAILDIALEVDIVHGTVQGFVFDESRTFFLDVKRSQVTLSGIEQPYNRNRVGYYEDDIYVDSKLLGQWLDIVFDVDFFAGMLFVRTSQILPFEAKMEREANIKKMKSRYRKREFDYNVSPPVFRAFGIPSIDQTLRLSLTRNHSQAFNKLAYYTGYLSSEIYGMQGTVYVDANNTEGMGDMRWQLRRVHPDNILLGGLRANEFRYGMVSTISLPMIMSPGNYAHGFYVSNFPNDRQLEFDRQTFSGDLLPGWEVELYQNNTLVGYQEARSDGLYEFNDIPLLFGNNFFKLKFYGPQGQVREENKQYYLSNLLTRPGQRYYRTMYSYDSALDLHRVGWNYEIGMNKQVSTVFRAAYLPVNDKELGFFSTGVRAFAGPFYFQADASINSEKGIAGEMGLQTRWRDITLSYRHGEFKDYQSDTNIIYADPILRTDQASLSLAIPATPWTYRMPLLFEGQLSQHASGYYRYELRNKISSVIAGAYISHDAKLTATRDGISEQSAHVLMSKRIGIFNFRTETNYELTDKIHPRDISAGLDGSIIGRIRYMLNVKKESLSDNYLYSAGLNGIFQKTSLRLDMGYSTNDTISVNFSMGTGAAFDPRTRGWKRDASPVADTGMLSLRVFLDKNRNGTFDEEDDPISGVGFHINGYPKFEFTDENGIAFLTRLPVSEYVSIGVREETIADPLWIPEIPGIKTVINPGRVAIYDFPVKMTGEIDGVTFISRGGVTKEIGEVMLELVDNTGTVIQQTTSAYDGFYVFTRVPMGQYTIRVAEDQIQRLNLIPATEVPVEITTDEIFKNAVDFTLRFRG